MTDRGGFWPGRRTFVLGCTGFLGTEIVRGLLARGAEVVGLVRDAARPSDFFRDKLYKRVHVVRGRAEDVHRLRHLFGVNETQLVFQCAADPRGAAEEYTRTAIAAAGRTPIVVPVCLGLALHPRATTRPVTSVTVVRLPALFGGGDHRWDLWPPRLFLAVARGEPLPPPPGDWATSPVGYVRHAAHAIFDAVAHSEAAGVRVIEFAGQGTGADLFAATRQPDTGPRLHHPTAGSVDRRPLAEAVAESVAWYRTAVPRSEGPGLMPPAPRAAA
jgi:nucleoside-diphosphate-sugar epimerase